MTRTPDLLKSVLKETPFNSSAVSSFRDRGDYSSVAVNLNDGFEFLEDPSFWKDHNVQVLVTALGFRFDQLGLLSRNFRFFSRFNLSDFSYCLINHGHKICFLTSM